MPISAYHLWWTRLLFSPALSQSSRPCRFMQMYALGIGGSQQTSMRRRVHKHTYVLSYCSTCNLSRVLTTLLMACFFDEWWWFSIFQVFPNDLSILLIMVLFNCSFASQGLASCWLWRPLMFAVVQRFYLAFWRFASFFFFPCSFNKGAVSRFLLLHLFYACFCYTLFCESGSWSRNKECILFFFRRPLNDFQIYRSW